MHAFQDPSALVQVTGGGDADAIPFLGTAPLSAAYLAWSLAWVAMVWGLSAASFGRKDL
jgi:hypothetical protein